jgi:hypothetical protein
LLPLLIRILHKAQTVSTRDKVDGDKELVVQRISAHDEIVIN